MGDRVTTVSRVRALRARLADVARYPAPDLTIERIGDLVEHHLDGLVAAAGALTNPGHATGRLAAGSSGRETKPF